MQGKCIRRPRPARKAVEGHGHLARPTSIFAFDLHVVQVESGLPRSNVSKEQGEVMSTRSQLEFQVSASPRHEELGHLVVP